MFFPASNPMGNYNPDLAGVWHAACLINLLGEFIIFGDTYQVNEVVSGMIRAGPPGVALSTL